MGLYKILPTVMLLWMLFALPFSAAQTTDHFMVEKVDTCKDVPDPPIKFYLTPVDFTPGAQIVDMNLTSPKPVGENSKVKEQFYLPSSYKRLKCIGYTEVAHRWLHVFTFEEDFCYVFKAYVGQLFYDLERSAAIMPGTCPIAKGAYHAVNSTLNFRTLKVQTFPFGRMKFRLETYDKSTKVLNSCSIVIVSNIQ